MKIHIYSSLIAILLFIVSCRSASQENETKSKSVSIESADSIKNTKKLEITYYADSSDIAVFEKLMNYAVQNKLKEKPISQIEIEMAKQFYGTPYVGHTLEKDSTESLVINLRELDCTTFVENLIAISFCIKNNTTKFNDYCEILVKIRYRDGQINEYPSRLHYTTEWLTDNQKKGIIKIVSNDFGTKDFNPNLNFMSTHPENYRQLANPKFVEEMKKHESRISLSKLKFIPKDKINELAKNINDGDIIAISTTIPGLDFSHIVIAAWHKNKLHFIHASIKEKKVILSEKTLQDYLLGMKTSSGIVVARLNEMPKNN